MHMEKIINKSTKKLTGICLLSLFVSLCVYYEGYK